MKTLSYFYSVRFRDGLQTCGMLQLIVTNVEQWSTVFVTRDSKLTAKGMMNLFQIEWSPDGSNRKRMEMRTVSQWRDWLIDIEGWCMPLKFLATEPKGFLWSLS